MQEYLTLYHHDSTVKTLADFMEKERIKPSVISVDELFEFNRLDIFNQMSRTERMEYCKALGKETITADDLKSDMTLPCPCTMIIDADKIDYELAISQTNFEAQTDNIYAFQNEQIQQIIQDSGYVINAETKKMAPECSVYGWFKSLYYVGALDGSEIQSTIKSTNNRFIDVSDYVVNLQTSVNANGGSFTIEFPIINSIEDFIQVKPYEGKEDYYTDRRAQKIDLYRFGRAFYHKAPLSAMDQNFFNWLVQSNDLLFISFEKLQTEYNLGGEIFDMIGLVDEVTVMQNANGHGSVKVRGRDLMKLLTDDSSLFFNTSTVWGKSQIFLNPDSAGRQGDIRSIDNVTTASAPIQRLRRTSNEIDPFADPFNRSIDYVMKGVISQLANIEVVPSYVFDDWGDRRTRFSEIYPDNTGNNGNSVGSSGEGSGQTDDSTNTMGNFDIKAFLLAAENVYKERESEHYWDYHAHTDAIQPSPLHDTSRYALDSVYVDKSKKTDIPRLPNVKVK